MGGGAEVLERGDVFFFYRPRVERHAPRGEEDVQRFLLVLAPDGRRVFRIVAVGRKRMPDLGARGRERSWGWVAKVAGDRAEIELELRGYRYATKTRGEREQPSARPAGEGAYAVAHHGDHSHLAYALARPAAPGDVQRELGIEAAASYVVAVKNPWHPAPRPVGLAPEAEAAYPPDVQARFRDRRWGALEPAHLDREGAELLLVGADEDPERELGIRLDPAERGGGPDVFRALGIDPAAHPPAPLFSGDWA
ncbi:MAG TPA: hypothetical protein VFL83_07545 [Anaeromyxobacter sp.]|nr:hypothetical protein [Anaeromyxobacter sp.]